MRKFLMLLLLALLLPSTAAAQGNRRVWLPMINGQGPRIVIPAVVEANVTSSVSMDPAVPNACFEELSPAAVVAAAAICPIPGRKYPVLSGGGSIALVGYGNNASRLAWGGSSTYTVLNPSAIIADADVISFGESITTTDTTAGPIVTSGPYTLIILPSVTEAVGAAGIESFREFQEQADFAKYLWDLIRATRERGVAMDRSGVWYDSVGTGTTPAALGCTGGRTINWVATGPVTVVSRGGAGFPRVLFKGRFLDPTEQYCMEPFVWVEVTRLMAIPALKDEVDRYRGAGAPPVWTWNIGDGLARTFSWVGWDYLSLFAIRSTGPGVPATSSFFLIVPTDFLRLDCSFLSGKKVCALEQEPGY